MISLNALQRRYLRGQAHHLHPVVMIGDAGLSEAVMREVDLNLKSHELIKVRIFGDDREQPHRHHGKNLHGIGCSAGAAHW